MLYKSFARALLLAGAVAAPLAPIVPAVAAPTPKFVICVVGTVGPEKIGTEPTAPIRYGFKVACSDLTSGTATGPDSRTIHVELQAEGGDKPRAVESFDDHSTDAATTVTHLYSCFGGTVVRYRVHWTGESAVVGGNTDHDTGDSEWVSLAC